MEILDMYGRGLDQFLVRVRAVPADRWAAPTPCDDWDVRQLVNHLVNEDRWTVPLFGGATIAEVGDRFDGDLLGDDPVASAEDAAAAARTAVAEPGALERTVQLSFGPTPAREYVMQLFADHLVHAWDLAAAVGADPLLDPACVRFCADWFARREETYRAGGAIGPAVDVPPGATAQDRLLAAFGRDPSWRPAAG